ncbi:hypothetical protein FNH22_10630 [Fulvivirga sp. M361]|uniref:hypothetical protein n=1 Tax=Fulvivirga sp. M361 TaxID=2594266 RepID=UPI00117BA860|nr:hypothetical protein [Fulvivirga sp. M361]TRX59592.1 hypothetical protein FNH22_10630 [Fulvivirga sp. M361]
MNNSKHITGQIPSSQEGFLHDVIVNTNLNKFSDPTNIQDRFRSKVGLIHLQVGQYSGQSTMEYIVYPNFV